MKRRKENFKQNSDEIWRKNRHFGHFICHISLHEVWRSTSAQEEQRQRHLPGELRKPFLRSYCLDDNYNLLTTIAIELQRDTSLHYDYNSYTTAAIPLLLMPTEIWHEANNTEGRLTDNEHSCDNRIHGDLLRFRVQSSIPLFVSSVHESKSMAWFPANFPGIAIATSYIRSFFTFVYSMLRLPIRRLQETSFHSCDPIRFLRFHASSASSCDSIHFHSIRFDDCISICVSTRPLRLHAISSFPFVSIRYRSMSAFPYAFPFLSIRLLRFHSILVCDSIPTSCDSSTYSIPPFLRFLDPSFTRSILPVDSIFHPEVLFHHLQCPDDHAIDPSVSFRSSWTSFGNNFRPWNQSRRRWSSKTCKQVTLNIIINKSWKIYYYFRFAKPWKEIFILCTNVIKIYIKGHRI